MNYFMLLKRTQENQKEHEKKVKQLDIKDILDIPNNMTHKKVKIH